MPELPETQKKAVADICSYLVLSKQKQVLGIGGKRVERKFHVVQARSIKEASASGQVILLIKGTSK